MTSGFFDPPEARARLVGLLDAGLLVPTPDLAADPGTCEVIEPEQLVVAMHEDEVGLAFPVFRTPDAFLRWRPEGGICAVRTGAEVVALALVDDDSRLAIDPGSADGFVASAAVLRSIVDATSVGVDPGGGGPIAPVLVAAPAEGLPDDLAEAIGAALREFPSVSAAHLTFIDDGSGSPGRCIALALADGVEPGAVMPAVVAAVGALDGAVGLTFTVVAADLAASVAASGVDLLAR